MPDIDLTPGARYRDGMGRTLTIQETAEGWTHYLLDGDTGPCKMRTPLLVGALTKHKAKRLKPAPVSGRNAEAPDA